METIAASSKWHTLWSSSAALKGPPHAVKGPPRAVKGPPHAGLYEKTCHSPCCSRGCRCVRAAAARAAAQRLDVLQRIHGRVDSLEPESGGVDALFLRPRAGRLRAAALTRHGGIPPFAGRPRPARPAAAGGVRSRTHA